jgi:hypothetical protein
MQELKITMLGSRGVGKTSLLTAMYDQFANNIGKTDLLLTPDEESSGILQERLIELKNLLDDFESVGGSAGIGATTGDPVNFIFGLGRKGKSPSLQLNFRDYSGEYHLDKKEVPLDQKQVRREFVKNLLTECVAVLVAIDAPALMEKNGKYHDRINRPQQIRNLFEAGYQDLDSPRLVIFAPVRCEKYMQNEKSALELIARIKEEYKGLLDLFGSELLAPYVSAVITPVQTVGSVVFSRIEIREDSPHFMFRKVSHDAKYSPKDSEQPLRYLLRFLLKLHLSNNRNWGFFNFLRDIFGMDDALVNAIRELSQGCKSNGGFAILQGNAWFSL